MSAQTLWHALSHGDTDTLVRELHAAEPTKPVVRVVPNALDRCFACDAESTDTIYINGIAYGVCERC